MTIAEGLGGAGGWGYAFSATPYGVGPGPSPPSAFATLASQLGMTAATMGPGHGPSAIASLGGVGLGMAAMLEVL